MNYCKGITLVAGLIFLAVTQYSFAAPEKVVIQHSTPESKAKHLSESMEHIEELRESIEAYSSCMAELHEIDSIKPSGKFKSAKSKCNPESNRVNKIVPDQNLRDLIDSNLIKSLKS